MKVKARDIISGWPKGRSTNVARSNILYCRFNMFREMRLSIGSSLYPKFLYKDSQYIVEDFRMYKFEEKFESTYHQMQQAMVNEWFAKYRLGDSLFTKQYERFVLSGEYGNCVVYEDFYLEEELEFIDTIKKHLLDSYDNRKVK